MYRHEQSQACCWQFFISSHESILNHAETTPAALMQCTAATRSVKNQARAARRLAAMLRGCKHPEPSAVRGPQSAPLQACHGNVHPTRHVHPSMPVSGSLPAAAACMRQWLGPGMLQPTRRVTARCRQAAALSGPVKESQQLKAGYCVRPTHQQNDIRKASPRVYSRIRTF